MLGRRGRIAERCVPSDVRCHTGVEDRAEEDRGLSCEKSESTEKTSGTSLNVQDTFDDYLARKPAQARGETFEESLDKARLDRSCQILASILRCYRGECSPWYTFDELQDAGMTCSLPSVSARLRELRDFLQSTALGQVQRQPRAKARRGLFEYRFNPDHTAPIRP